MKSPLESWIQPLIVMFSGSSSKPGGGVRGRRLELGVAERDGVALDVLVGEDQERGDLGDEGLRLDAVDVDGALLIDLEVVLVGQEVGVDPELLPLVADGVVIEVVGGGRG